MSEVEGANPARTFGMVRRGPQSRADSSGIFAGADASVGENNHGSDVGRLGTVLVGRTEKFFLGLLLRSFVQRDWTLGLGRFSTSGRAYNAYV
jgi:hypothetical protein